MTLQTIAVFKSPLTSKFGTPRQSGIVEGLKGEIIFNSAFRNPDFIKGMEGFDYIWLLWLFSENNHDAVGATVRPPLLGGNETMGVFATRSPYRPNPIGLSSVRLLDIEYGGAQGPVIHVEGADLIDVLSPEVRKVVSSLLEQDPRPHYHNDPARIYGMPFNGRDIRFQVQGNVLTVVEII